MLAPGVKPSRSNPAQGNRRREIDPKTEIFRQDQVEDFEFDCEVSRRVKKKIQQQPRPATSL